MSLPIVPERPDDEAWDVVVVGAGMGGGTLGFALAQRGFRVLFLERGLYLFGDHDRGTGSLDSTPEDPDGRMRRGYWPHPIKGRSSFGPVEFFGPFGAGTGGSSSVYAAQLERMRPADFEPRRHHPTATDSTLPEHWPISYDELLPYYRRAETLYDVCGTDDPLQPDPEAPVRPPPPMSERDAFVFDALRASDLNPYRAHVGSRFVPGCVGCGGALCPKSCKADSGRVCVVPAVTSHGARILPSCEVLRIEATASRAERVVCRVQGREISVTGKVIVLAAGALMTPTLLLRSQSSIWPDGLANRSGRVGRNLMMHTSDQLAIRPSKTLPAEGPQKAISLNDFYLRNGRKLGNLQSMGVPVSAGVISEYLKQRAQKDPKWYLQMGRLGRKVASTVGAAIFGQSVVMASIVEDLPYHENRVVLDASSPNGMRFEYTYPAELRERNQLFRDELQKAVSKHLTALTLSGENNLNFGHVCGTCRAGEDPTTSVVDRDGRCHELENLFIADSSYFPSAGGINPSLTIAANALRIADRIASSLA
ncbi:MAG: GMC family oxidoreductase [Myxococcota bacterium]|jgi:choline dehydrogenase-like flavoprotein|nr:GMC family oxidoreductase [Myxococcota bacterium]